MKVENFQQSVIRASVADVSYEDQGFEESPPDEQAIQRWLRSKFGELLGVKAGEIDIQEPLSNYGLGSIQAVSLTGDLEDWLGLQLPPTLLWDYSSIDALAKHLCTESRFEQPAL